jgi:hypothetical protein
MDIEEGLGGNGTGWEDTFPFGFQFGASEKVVCLPGDRLVEGVRPSEFYPAQFDMVDLWKFASVERIGAL